MLTARLGLDDLPEDTYNHPEYLYDASLSGLQEEREKKFYFIDRTAEKAQPVFYDEDGDPGI